MRHEEKINQIIDAEIEFLEKHGKPVQYQCMSAEERILCLINIKEKINSHFEEWSNAGGT